MNASRGTEGDSLAVAEYQSLYTEIADLSRRVSGALQICVLGFTSVMAFIFSAEFKAVTLPQIAYPALFLLPSFIILMCLAQVRSSFATIVRTATYISVFYEQHDPSVSWQARMQQLRLRHEESRSLERSLWYRSFERSLWYIFLPLFVSSLLFSFLTLFSIDMGITTFWWRIVVASVYAAAYVALFIIFYKMMKELHHVWGAQHFGEMINCWMELRAETNEDLKKRLTSENSAGCSSG